MPGLTKITQSARQEDVKRKWHLIDLRGKVLGRAVTEIAQLLIGKNKATFTPHVDGGDTVVVINARDVKLTGRKADQKVYTSYTKYPGGLKEVPFSQLMDKDPRKVIQNAVSGMLPKNRHRDRRMTRLHVFAGSNHPFKDKFSS